MKNNKLRATLTKMLAVRQIRLADKDPRRIMTDAGKSYVREEVEALHEALVRLSLFSEERVSLATQKILLDWSEPDT